jgi:membrane protein
MTGTADEAIPPPNKIPGEPDTPLEIGGKGWKATLKRSAKEFTQDRCPMIAGSLAYHWFLALFPAFIAALGVMSLVGIGGGTFTKLTNGMEHYVPQGVSSIFTQAIHAAAQKTSGGTTAVILGLLIALWSASSGFVALQSGLDIAYDVPVSRKFIGARLRSFVLMAGTVVLGGLAACLIVLAQPIGLAIEGHLPFAGTVFIVIWSIVRWVLAVAVVTVLFSFYYYFGPNRESPSWQWVSPGGLVGTAIFIAASVGFSFYVSSFGHSSYSKTYGALAGVVILILWFYLIGVAVLLGAELNAETERQAAAEAGHPAAQRSAAEIEQSKTGGGQQRSAQDGPQAPQAEGAGQRGRR